MIDFELGSVDFWVGHEKHKPYPVSIYRKNGEWIHEAHPRHELNSVEKVELNLFVKERIQDIKSIWKQNMSTRLKWELPSAKGDKGKQHG